MKRLLCGWTNALRVNFISYLLLSYLGLTSSTLNPPFSIIPTLISLFHQFILLLSLFCSINPPHCLLFFLLPFIIFYFLDLASDTFNAVWEFLTLLLEDSRTWTVEYPRGWHGSGPVSGAGVGAGPGSATLTDHRLESGKFFNTFSKSDVVANLAVSTFYQRGRCVGSSGAMTYLRTACGGYDSQTGPTDCCVLPLTITSPQGTYGARTVEVSSMIWLVFYINHSNFLSCHIITTFLTYKVTYSLTYRLSKFIFPIRPTTL